MNKYPYLKDSAFLFDLFRTRNLEQFVNITVLNFDEKPLKEVQGKVLSGNFNLDGNSSVRRTGNLSMFIEARDADYMEVNAYFSMNKKIKVEIGLTNNTNKYTLFMYRVTKLHIFLDIQAKSSTFAMIFNQNEEICYE